MAGLKQNNLIFFFPTEIQNLLSRIHFASLAMYMKCSSSFLSHMPSLYFSLWPYQHNPKKMFFSGLNATDEMCLFVPDVMYFTKLQFIINIVDPKLTWRHEIRSKTTRPEPIKISLYWRQPGINRIFCILVLSQWSSEMYLLWLLSTDW